MRPEGWPSTAGTTPRDQAKGTAPNEMKAMPTRNGAQPSMPVRLMISGPTA